jgi:uncharacterized protein (TIGR02466 family)|tara:strand:+ start:1334 stop:1945 length:612 start_codon:yes stop_codon:yes gene_type:complete
MKAIINGIFSTPVYISKLERKFTDTELKFVKKSKLKIFPNEGNTTSNNNYILNEKPFNTLKKELDKIIKDYFDKVISPSNNIKPYITQSWLNYTEKDQYHHQHSHDNSIVSGVLYLNADKENDKIKFIKEEYKIISPEIKNYNVWNSESWFFSVETGQVVLFPSSLTHMVENKKGTNTRISLSFNTFITGILGDNKKLTELKL